MHALKMLHQMLGKNCPEIHATRLTALMDVVDALVHGQTLTVTGLGRCLPRDISMKHGIKQSDRLISYPHLQGERMAVYQTVARRLIRNHTQPIIVVDWSDCTYNRNYLLLRAAVPVGGRSLTLYEEVHDGQYYGNARIQKRFLKTLQQLLPSSCVPVIVTDAGFTGPWFQAVEKMGWNYVGRIWKCLMYRKVGDGDWLKCSDLFSQTGTKPRYYGAVELVRSNPFNGHLYHYRRPKRGRHKKTVYGQKAHSRHSQKNALREETPWLLISSLGQDRISARQVIQLYRTRMQIEEAFRDIKNSRTGFL